MPKYGRNGNQIPFRDIVIIQSKIARNFNVFLYFPEAEQQKMLKEPTLFYCKSVFDFMILKQNKGKN